MNSLVQGLSWNLLKTRSDPVKKKKKWYNCMYPFRWFTCRLLGCLINCSMCYLFGSCILKVTSICKISLLYRTKPLARFMWEDRGKKKGVRIFMASENKTHILCKMSGVCMYILAKFKISVVFVFVLTVVKDVCESDLRVNISVKNCYWLHLYCPFYCCTYLASKVYLFPSTVHFQTEKMIIMQGICFITVVCLDVEK